MTLFVTSCMELNKQKGLASITGNVIFEDGLEPQQTEQVIPSCKDKCTPEGTFCVGKQLHSCKDTNKNGCLSLSTIHCTFGCNFKEKKCNKEPTIIQRIPQSELLRAPITEIPTMDNCTGSLQGVAEWNPNNAVCRKSGGKAPLSGYANITTCCKRFFSQTDCTKDLGMMKRGLVLSSQFFAIGCYDR